MPTDVLPSRVSPLDTPGIDFWTELFKELISKVFVFGSIALILLLIGACIYFLYFHKKRKSTIDELKKQITNNAKKNWAGSYNYLRRLYRSEISPQTLDGCDEKKRKEIIKNLRKTNVGIPYGEIIGFNVHDLWVSKDDYLVYQVDAMQRMGKIPDKESIERMQKEIDTWLEKYGNQVFIIVYKKSVPGWLGFPKKVESTLLLTKNNIGNYEDIGGNLTFYGMGTQELGLFEIPSGDSGLVQLLSTDLRAKSLMNVTLGMIGSEETLVRTAMGLDTDTDKTVRMMRAYGFMKSTEKKRNKDE